MIHEITDAEVIDRAARAAVAFTRAYAQSPICSPSRASFLTGLYPSTVHVNRNGLPRFPEQDHIRLIIRKLADIGYDCGLSGKLHIASAWNGVEERSDDGYELQPGLWWSPCHPRLSAQGIDVVELLCSPEVRNIIKERDIQLINHRELWDETNQI